eukprot:m.75805 g.75805  ORF g.75805 m.75805 type:complete len:548 (+) comp35957_c0_seq1:63-1706(+)
MPGDMETFLLDIFKSRDKGFKGYLTPQELHQLYAELRAEELSYAQVEASVKAICMGDVCASDEFSDCLKEMDRRYVLVQDLQWEFSLLATEGGGFVSERQAEFLMKAVHDEMFSQRRWNRWKSKRVQAGSGIPFREIEVELCNLPDGEPDDEQELTKVIPIKRSSVKVVPVRKESQSREKPLERKRSVEKKVTWESKPEEAKEVKEKKVPREFSSSQKEVRSRSKEKDEGEHQRKLQAEEQDKKEKQEAIKPKEEEKQRTRPTEKEEKREKTPTDIPKPPAKSETPVKKISAVPAKPNKAKSKAVEEKEASTAAKKAKAKKINDQLDHAISSEKIEELEPAVKEAEDNKGNLEGDLDLRKLEKAKELLRKLQAAKNLDDAVGRRKIEALKRAIDDVRSAGLERMLAREMAEADQLLAKLKKLEQFRKAVLNLDQRTIAELKSYGKPPRAVHNVMMAVFVLLGHSEKDTKKWQTVQALIGKTGKESLKRRVGNCDPEVIPRELALKVENILKQDDLTTVSEASKGAAVFFVWAEGMVEEAKEYTRAKS